MPIRQSFCNINWNYKKTTHIDELCWTSHGLETMFRLGDRLTVSPRLLLKIAFYDQLADFRMNFV